MNTQEYNQKDKAFFDEAFTNPVTHEPYAIPAKLRTAATRIARAFGITGICDPMYIANVIAVELGLGDGNSNFNTVTQTDPYQPGAILESSWGYDQTNIDFFKIVKRTNDTVFLIPLKSRNIKNDGYAMRGTSEPGEPYSAGEYVSCIGEWNGKPIRRRLARYKESINNPPHLVGKVFGCSIKHGWCNLWDGQPSHWTSYA